MATDENEQSPWTRPGFVTAAIVVGAEPPDREDAAQHED